MIIFGLFALIVLAVILYSSLWFAYGFLYFKRIDSVDIAWGLGFIYLAIIGYLIFSSKELIPTIGLILVIIWGLRLSLHIGFRFATKSEDSRYKMYRKKWQKNLNISVFLKIFLLQGFLIAAISTASIGVISGKDFNIFIATVGIMIWMIGIFYESIADYQLAKFVKTKKPDRIMKTGLWKYSRHPNYFGEIVVWSGAGLVACSASNFWGLIGPLVITYLIVKVSGIPPLEKRYKNNSEYQAYKQKTPVLAPFSFKK